MSKKQTGIQAYESGLNDERHNAIAGAFNPFAAEIQGIIKDAEAITVTSETDVAAMAAARKDRLALRRIRVDVENTRKELKEASLREGKAIEGMANIIKYMIVPVEEALQAKEDFVKRAEERRKAELSELRASELARFEIDSSCFDLAGMNDQAYAQLLSTSEAGYKAKKEAEKREAERIEAERVAEEKARAERIKAEQEERARIEAENAKLRKQAEADAKERAKVEAAQRKAEAEAVKLRKEIVAREQAAKEEAARAERARKDAEAKAERDNAERERAEKEAELARIKAEKEAEQAALAAPDADKITRLVDDICALHVPAVSSEAALAAIHEVRGMLNGVVKRLRDAAKELTTTKKARK